MTTVLVTGGAGYIGSHAAKALADAGHRPVVLDNLSTGRPGDSRDARARRYGPFVEADLRDGDALDAAFRDHGIEAVMHFAALSEVGGAEAEPARYWANNVGGSLSLLQAMGRAGCSRLVFSSTCAVYGDGAADGGLDEDTDRRPAGTYGSTKRAVEDLIADIGRATGLQAVIFRYFNVAGADPGGEIGEAHDPETHLVPRTLAAAAGEGPPLTVMGSDYPTPDGTPIRDYVHVVDLVAAHLLGLDRLMRGEGGRVYNLGSGRGYSVREVIGVAERVTGRTVPVIEGPRRAGDAVRLVAAPDRAAAELGWRPERGLDAMIGDAWRWHGQAGF